MALPANEVNMASPTNEINTALQEKQQPKTQQQETSSPLTRNQFYVRSAEQLEVIESRFIT